MPWRLRIIYWMGFFLLACGGARGDWLREIEIRNEPAGQAGILHYSVRLTPSKSMRYDAVTFDLFYHQTFPWETPRGRKTMKVHEPVSFTYRRRPVDLVADLDMHIAFRVPIDRAALDQRYGPTTFNKDYPVSIQRMVITGLAGGETVWSYSIPADGRHDITRLEAEQRAREKAKRTPKDNLDDLMDEPRWLK